MTFKSGESGNPKGRPAHQSLKWFNEILAGREDALLRKAIVMALEGDQDMMKFVLGRKLPAIPKENPSDIDLANKSYVEQGEEVIKALSEQRITASEAYSIMASIATNVKTYEATELIKRIQALEDQAK